MGCHRHRVLFMLVHQIVGNHKMSKECHQSGGSQIRTQNFHWGGGLRKWTSVLCPSCLTSPNERIILTAAISFRYASIQSILCAGVDHAHLCVMVTWLLPLMRLISRSTVWLVLFVKAHRGPLAYHGLFSCSTSVTHDQKKTFKQKQNRIIMDHTNNIK